MARAIDTRGGVVWLADGVRPEHRAADAETLVPRRRVALDAPVLALALDDVTGSLWPVSRWGGTVGVVEPGSGRVLIIDQVDEPGAKALDSLRRVLWVANLADGALHRLAARAAGDR